MSQTEMGSLTHVPTTYGKSVDTLPLQVYLPLSNSARILLMASIHGDESLSTVLLSECLRMTQINELRAAVILAANPDGVLRGTRSNANGVDLNRNFPASNWSRDLVHYRNKPGDPQNIPLSPGISPGSEPETQALISLIDKLKPQMIISIHGFLNCVDDPEGTSMARDMSERSGMELVPDVGYATPGSFGSWCAERSLSIITYELPSDGMDTLREIHHPIFTDVMRGHYESLLG